MPKNATFRTMLQDRLESLSGFILLPAFFAVTGLHTEVGSLTGSHQWLWCLTVIAVAVIGKWGGVSLLAKISGMDQKSSIVLGSLMNTRGLVELVVLNIARQLGILSPALFTMLVLMAVATTMMAGPVVHFWKKNSVIKSAR